MKRIGLENQLRTAGFRATPGRVAILEILSKESKPLTVEELNKKLHKKLNNVTLYRAIKSLIASNILRRVDLQHGHAHYELALEHHHHAVCKNCGIVENIEVPHPPSPEKDALKVTKKFSIINDYSLEFFGLCKKCA